ncbi:MAG: hypothetical protein O2894_12180 [Planctomycetota bacterium]|nr:hypothetical protein [Planctomycetota bacterium]
MVESKQADVDEAIAAIQAHFDRLQIGSRKQRTVTYSESEVSDYVRRVGIEYPGRYRENGARLVPPGMIFLPPARTYGLQEGPPMARGGFFTAAKRSYRRPVRLDETLTFDGELSEKFERGGYYYIVVRWTARGADGVEVGEGEEEHTLGSARKPRPS